MPYRFHEPTTPLARGLHPLVRSMFREALRQHCTLSMLAQRTGINLSTVRGWRAGKSPKLADIDNCFQVLGFRLTIQEVEE